MGTPTKKSDEKSIWRRVGNRVGVPMGGRVLAGRVVEDRGALAGEGKQVVRVAVEDPTSADSYPAFDVPVAWLVAAPRRV